MHELTATFVAAGAAAAVIVALFVLWQSAGGDAGSVRVGTTVDADAEEAPDANGESPPADGEMGASAPSVEVAALEVEIASQAAAIASLEDELADISPPAIDGADMRRIVVAADASFVSVGNEGVAVIGPFGGYAAIDPATNAVTATSQGAVSPYLSRGLATSPARTGAAPASLAQERHGLGRLESQCTEGGQAEEERPARPARATRAGRER